MSKSGIKGFRLTGDSKLIRFIRNFKGGYVRPEVRDYYTEYKVRSKKGDRS